MQARHSAIAAILLGGVIAGTIDIFAASAINGFVDPVRVLKFIAGGLVGLKQARAGGMEMAALGAALQIGMSILIAAIYVAGTNFLPSFKRNWLPSGLAFGAGVFVVMEYAVVPLSKIGAVPPPSLPLALNFLAMLLFGTIVAWFARA